MVRENYTVVYNGSETMRDNNETKIEYIDEESEWKAAKKVVENDTEFDNSQLQRFTYFVYRTASGAEKCEYYTYEELDINK